MKFNYETQGAITYLVCELDADDKLDSLTLGMLTNNHISGVAAVLYTEMNGQRFLKYNISAKVSSNQFFSGSMNKQRIILAFQNILNALCVADEYMIDQKCFSVVPEHVFLNVSNCETALICIPVDNKKASDNQGTSGGFTNPFNGENDTEKNINSKLADFFKTVLSSVQFSSQEDAECITQLKEYLNDSSSFNVYEFKNLVENIANGTAARSNAYNQPAYNAVNTPFSSFNETISIEDMPGMGMPQPNGNAPQMNFNAQKQPVVMPKPPVYNNVQNSPINPSAPISKPVVVQEKDRIQQPIKSIQQPNIQANPGYPIPGQQPRVNPQNAANGRMAPNARPNQGYPIPGQQPRVNPQNAANGRMAPNAQANPGYPIPGQQPFAPNVPMNTSNANATDANNMSFFKLLCHYNKDNLEVYKVQKAAKKQNKSNQNPPKQKKAKAKNMPTPVAAANNGGNQMYNNVPFSQQPSPQGNRPMMPQQPSPQVNRPMMPQQPSPQMYHPIQQPLPVQNSFNETTVLSSFEGETTVLGNNSGISQPYLLRDRTREKIVIDKPVFRIGKEKSYVDYFITDNTAISRSHCNIHSEDGEYFIVDTNSTNHTYLNGKIINSNVKVKLTNGDKIRLANEDFTFLL